MYFLFSYSDLSIALSFGKFLIEALFIQSTVAMYGHSLIHLSNMIYVYKITVECFYVPKGKITSIF